MNLQPWIFLFFDLYLTMYHSLESEPSADRFLHSIKSMVVLSFCHNLSLVVSAKMTSSLLVTFFLTVALGASAFGVRFNNDINVLARFYSDFGQIYLRPSSMRAVPYGLENDTSVEYYEFFFTTKEFSQLREQSLTMLNTHVLERTVTYHPTPNFEAEGARYLYRRDPKQNESVEIELVDRFSRLFREVNQTNHYFYLSSVDELQYVDRMPSLPYYEVAFKCNGSSKNESSLPILSYIDQTYKWSPRYSLDMPTFAAKKESTMLAYADIRQEGERTVVIKALELIAGKDLPSWDSFVSMALR